MTTTDDYVDVRKGMDDYEQRNCPECGKEAWFKHLERKSWRTDQWNCRDCGAYYEDTLEYPCPECDIRMVLNEWRFECKNKTCEHNGTAINRERLLNRLSSDDYPEYSHKPGVLMGECPVCGDETGVNGGPDGELECQACGDFYAGQYSDVWFNYAIWLRNKDKIRVNEP